MDVSFRLHIDTVARTYVRTYVRRIKEYLLLGSTYSRMDGSYSVDPVSLCEVLQLTVLTVTVRDYVSL